MGDHRLFVVRYADRFYEDVPLDVRSRGPWRGKGGDVIRLKPEVRLALAQAGYVLINCPDAMCICRTAAITARLATQILAASGSESANGV